MIIKSEYLYIPSTTKGTRYHMITKRTEHMNAGSKGTWKKYFLFVLQVYLSYFKPVQGCRELPLQTLTIYC